MRICNAIRFTGNGQEHIHCTLPEGHIGHHYCDYPGGCAEWLNSGGSITTATPNASPCDDCELEDGCIVQPFTAECRAYREEML